MNIIKVFGKPYTIECFKDHAANDPAMGYSDIKSGEIKISNGMTEEQKDTTLLHEILHIIAESLAYDLDEKIICGLSEGLYSAGCRVKVVDREFVLKKPIFEGGLVRNETLGLCGENNETVSSE